MKYFEFTIFADVDGQNMFFEIIATDLSSAKADIESAYGTKIEIINSSVY